jgi:hypothetical protein
VKKRRIKRQSAAALTTREAGISGSLIASTTRSSRRNLLLVVIAVLFASVLAFHGISNNIFWDDEANTALFARNILVTGAISGWDGTNIVGFHLGRELDEHLRQVYVPPLQYYFAAASLAVFGQTTFGGRALFVLLGLLAILLVALWTRRYLDDTHAWCLPALILAVTPAYLLYIRQCRYYSMGVLFTLILLYAFHAQGTTRRGQIARYSASIAATVLLFFTNYIYAASMLGALPIFFAFKHLREKRHFIFLGAIYTVATMAGLYVLITANPFSAHMLSPDAVTGMKRFFTLLWWHLSGLSTFEFFPVLVIPIIVMPFFLKNLKAQRPLGYQGLALLGFMFVYAVITALFTPQVVSATRMADMRQVVPLIAIGAVVSSIALIILWRLWRPAAIIVGIIMCFSNLGHLTFMDKEGAQGVRSTLFEYVRENFNNYTTGTEAMVDYLRTVPAGTIVQILPAYMIYPPMFYVPNLHYCCQLSVGKAIDPELRALLPDYVFAERSQPELVLTGSHVPVGQALAYFNQRFGFGSYRLETTIPIYWRDESRPEIPWHSFRPPSEKLNSSQGISVLKLNTSR